MLILPAMAAPPAAAGTTGDPDQSRLEREIIQLMRQDLRSEALPLCRSYNEKYPGDADMLYNQACLENTEGHPEEAAAAFAQAVKAGFDDFDLARSDPDLADLQDHPALINLGREHDESLALTAAERAVTLAWQEMSRPLPLTRSGITASSDEPDIFLTWTPTGLDIELRAAGPWAGLVGPDLLAPWNGGPGLVVTLGLPEADSPARTANYFVFAFGTESERPIGAVYLAGQKRWQAVAEMAPKIRVDENGNIEVKTMVPWTAILPYDPVVDDQLGFNAALRVPGEQGEHLASFLHDPAAFRPRSLIRRIVPLAFDTASISGDVLVGKVSGTISGNAPLTVDLVAVSETSGSGRLTIDFLGGPDQSLLPGGKASGNLELTSGLNRIKRQADFSALKTGAYVIKAEMEFPSGAIYSWGSTILQLAPGWSDDYGRRVDALPPHEKPTARYHLDSIIRAVADHHPRRGPGPIITTLNELGRLLDNADQEGSILPESGLFQLVYLGPEGDTRLCHVYLPAGWKIAKVLNPVVILTAATNMAAPIADRTGQNYEQGRQKPTLKAGQDEGFPVYLVPRLARLDSRRPENLVSEAMACLNWARSTFDSPTVSVACSDLAAGAALQFAPEGAGGIKALAIYAGRDLEPWPQADKSFIQSQLTDFPASIPVTWIDFVTETRVAGQAPLILEVLQEQGARIVEVQKVRGGNNFTQVADRAVLWAEGLR
jgi:hypothetical protein